MAHHAPLAGAPPLVQPVPARRAVLRPLTPDRYEIRFTASAQTREKLRVAQDLLRHAIPSGDLAEVIDRALTVLLKDLARKKFAATERPRASRGTAPGIHPHRARGEGTTENIRLLCRAHNAYESELFYGHGRPAEGATRPGTSRAPPP